MSTPLSIKLHHRIRFKTISVMSDPLWFAPNCSYDCHFNAYLNTKMAMDNTFGDVLRHHLRLKVNEYDFLTN